MVKKLKSLSLKKEVIANLQDEDQKFLKGGIGYGEADLWGSRVTCLTNFNTGGCGKSKSCDSIICIPL